MLGPETYVLIFIVHYRHFSLIQFLLLLPHPATLVLSHLAFFHFLLYLYYYRHHHRQESRAARHSTSLFLTLEKSNVHTCSHSLYLSGYIDN